MPLANSPEAVFAEAQAAMERGDWDGFFACLDRNDLLRIAENGLVALLGSDEKLLEALAADYSFPLESLETIRDKQQKMMDSATAISRPQSAPEVDPKAMLERSQAHRQIVKDYQKAVKDSLKGVPQLSRFTAALERGMRNVMGGGSVSSKLFVGEVLEDVSVSENQAWGTRRFAQGSTEDVGFVKRKGAWFIRLFARRPK